VRAGITPVTRGEMIDDAAVATVLFSSSRNAFVQPANMDAEMAALRTLQG
jgi:hypothetical protein